jgi:hypothetical protein
VTNLFTASQTSPLLLKLALEYSVREVHENVMELKLNRKHTLLDYTDDVNLLGDT